MDVAISDGAASDYAAYIDWRAEHPSDDLMTELLTAEFTDEHGTVRTLTRDEILGYIGLLCRCGQRDDDASHRLGGASCWPSTPTQRRALAADPALIPNAIEECLRYEAPSPVQARYVTQDVEHQGQTVPAGSAMVLLNGSANRDERQFPDPDRFDVTPQDPAAPELRLRHPLLPGRPSGPPRGAHRARRGAGPVPRLGDRPRQRRAGPDLDRPRLGEAPGAHPVTAADPTRRSAARA